MNMLRNIFSTRLAVLLLNCVCLLAAGTHTHLNAQPASVVADDGARGLELYKKGDDEGAIKALRITIKQQPENWEAWYYLGLALNRKSDIKDARKAFEKAMKLRPEFAAARTGFAYASLFSNKLSDARREAIQALKLNSQDAEAYYVIGVVNLREEKFEESLLAGESALKLNKNLAAAHLLKSLALLQMNAEDTRSLVNQSGPKPPSDLLAKRERRVTQARRYRDAAESLESYLKLAPQIPDAETWREQLATLRVYAKYAEEPDDQRSIVQSSDDSVTKAVLLNRPEPVYRDGARQAGVSGEVLLRAVLAKEGTVKHILVIQSLSHGLTEEAVAAARKIKFKPAMKNGQPVSQYVTLVYNFRFY